MTMPTTGGPGAGGAGAPGAELNLEPGLPARRGAGQGTGEGAREQIREVKERVVDQAKSTIRQARDRASSSLSESRLRAADQIGGIASAFHRTSEHLRGEDQARVAGLADSLARQVDQIASYLHDADGRKMARDLEGLARRRPAIVIGAAFALGLAAVRFFKSSEGDGEMDEYGRYDRIRAGGDPAGIGAGGFDAGI